MGARFIPRLAVWLALLPGSAALASCGVMMMGPDRDLTRNNPLESFTQDSNTLRQELHERLEEFLARRQWREVIELSAYASSRFPYEPRFHLVSAYAYAREAERGSASGRGLAITAANLALRLSDGGREARRMLAALNYREGDYAQAKFFLASLLRSGRDASVLTALLEASWRSGDIAMALWASERLAERAAPQDVARAHLLVALAAAALGDATRLQAARAKALGGAPNAAVRAQWEEWIGYWQAAPAPASAAETPTSAAEPPPRVVEIPAPPRGSAPPRRAGGAGREGAPQEPPPEVTAYPRWDDCVQRSHSAVDSGGYRSGAGQSGSNFALEQFREEMLPLEALPAPCKEGTRPRTALIDVTIIKSFGGERQTYGINALRSLNLVFNAGLEHSDVLAGAAAGSSGFGTSNAGNMTLLTSSLTTPRDGIQYALNIAENYYDGVHVESRPTVTVMDRLPTVLFAGRTVTVALEGQYGGNLEEKPVGVVVSVTPTFLSEDEVMLAVRATYSKILEGREIGTFANSLATSKNSLSSQAILRMGETLVLSGLRERVSEQVNSEVPFLGRVPGLNLLFRQRNRIASSSDMTVLVSLRRARTNAPQEALQDLVAMRPRFAEEIRARAGRAPDDRQLRRFLAQDILPLRSWRKSGTRLMQRYMRLPPRPEAS